MKHKFIIFIVGILTCLNASAFDFIFNEVAYNLLPDEKSCEVTFNGTSESGSPSPNYAGDIVIPERVTNGGKTLEVISVGDNAFFSCGDLKSIVIPNSVRRIGKRAFLNCRGLVTAKIPDSVEEIGESAFSYCSSLADVKIPVNIQVLGSMAFYSCAALKSIVVPNSLSTIPVSAFANSGLVTVDLPSSITKICSSAFMACQNLKKVELSNVSTIEMYAFQYCSNLESVILSPELSVIQTNAFDGCSNLGKVYIGDDVCNGYTIDLSKCSKLTELSSYTFSGCSKIETVNLPVSLNRIGSSTFNNCKGIKHISSCAINAPISSNPFVGVNTLGCIFSVPTGSINSYSALPYWNQLMNRQAKGEIKIEVVDEDGMTYENCGIYFKKGVAQAVSLKARPLNGEQIAKETLPGCTASGHSLFVENSNSVSIEIMPVWGTWVKSIFYDGVDVTDEFDLNIYVTPVVKANEVKTLKVVLYKNVPSGVESNMANGIKVISGNGVIKVIGTEGECVEVYNHSGQCVYRGMQSSISLAKGIYVVRVAGTVHKVIL